MFSLSRNPFSRKAVVKSGRTDGKANFPKKEAPEIGLHSEVYAVVRREAEEIVEEWNDGDSRLRGQIADAELDVVRTQAQLTKAEMQLRHLPERKPLSGAFYWLFLVLIFAGELWWNYGGFEWQRMNILGTITLAAVMAIGMLSSAHIAGIKLKEHDRRANDWIVLAIALVMGLGLCGAVGAMRALVPGADGRITFAGTSVLWGIAIAMSATNYHLLDSLRRAHRKAVDRHAKLLIQVPAWKVKCASRVAKKFKAAETVAGVYEAEVMRWHSDTFKLKHSSLVPPPQLMTLAIALLLPTLVFISGCGARHKPLVVAVNLDRSGSMDGQTVKELAAIEELATKMDGGDVMLISSFTNNAENAPAPIELRMPADEPLATERQKEDGKETFLRDVTKAAKTLLETKPARAHGSLRKPVVNDGTDVIGEFDRAGAWLSAPEFAHFDKRLVMVSDMTEQGHEVDFSSANLDANDRAAIIDSQRRSRGLPDIQGVRVWALCVGKAPGEGLSPRRQILIRKFWKEFVKAAGGCLSDSQYGQLLSWSTKA